MASNFTVKPPAWFWVVAVLLLLWELIGVYACVQQFRLGADAMGPATDYDRKLFATMPVWYNWVYALAVGTGALGAIAMLARKALAKPLYIVSTIAVVVQFGWLFVSTDIIAAKGVWVTYFPAFIVVLSLFAVWLADKGIKRGWLS